ncbi:MAG: hypothetical protein A2580_18235 [Hydrogenophilales bacterium RIFOXYD1_FULL_62_11]|nr:MAG: hypothetical protein A2580_18235 [Hydrogenophilales bacterium RIFOXYD1_FULL_62_11]
MAQAIRRKNIAAIQKRRHFLPMVFDHTKEAVMVLLIFGAFLITPYLLDSILVPAIEMGISTFNT